jgi:hypothetical protein
MPYLLIHALMYKNKAVEISITVEKKEITSAN